MTIREYCLNLLQECGCKQDCYKRAYTRDVVRDLVMHAREENITYPYLIYDMANTLIRLGNEVPDPPPPKWQIVWDSDSCCGGQDCDSFEEAKDGALDTLLLWMTDDMPKSRDNWDYMICDSNVSVYKRRDDIPDDMRTDKYDQNDTDWDDVWEEYWEPSQEELNEIGWMLFEDMPEEMQKEYTKYWGSCAKEEEGHDD